ncbi:MAG: alpha/beta fold hydrolase [Gemmatimonadetes bacterium]|nr:alpha/beta fold hydrolase [Gemmatimonadota bacterium]
MNPPTPVVFLHAFPFDGTMWDGQVAALTGRTVLTPSFPGFGGRAPDEPSLDRFAEVVVGDMQAAGIESAVLVGLSMGGYVAFRIQVKWPTKVAALVLADTKAGADDEAGRKKRTQQADRVRAEGIGWLAEALIPALLGETTRRERPHVVDAVRAKIAAANPEGVARALLAMRDRPDSTQELAGIRIPVLALVGEEDGLTPPAEARRIAEGVPHGRLVVIPGVGHLSNFENPEAFNEAIASLLNRRVV